MRPSYNDIRSRIAEEPKWFTVDGVPRYEEFTPKMLGVYDNLAGLFVVRCQSCGRTMLVGDGTPRLSLLRVALGKTNQLTIEEFTRGWACGDPPRHDCPGAGETMSATEIAVMEAWEQIDMEWQRRSDLERPYWAIQSASAEGGV